MGKQKSLKEEAKAYEPKNFKNISELDEVLVSVNILDGEGTNKQNEIFKYKYFVLDDEDKTEVRVPFTVLEQLKAHLTENPDLERFKVNKTGEGLNTSYTVIPLK